MKKISHLPEAEQQHYILCDCGHYIDMRSLADVFEHLHTPNSPALQWSHSVKKGEAVSYSRSGKKINLN